MMKLYILGVNLVAVFFLGCSGEKDYYMMQDTVSQIASFSQIEEEVVDVFEDKLIEGKTFISSVNVGDKIYLSVYGEEIKVQFHEERQVVDSFWLEPACKFSPVTDIEICNDQQKKGKCEIFYRKQGDTVSQPLLFDPKNYPLKLVIGEKAYPLSQAKLGHDHLKATFVIKKEMLKNGDDLFFDIVPIGSESREFKLGFLKFGRCDGKEGLSFSVRGNTATYLAVHKKRYQFKVTLSRETREI